MFGRGSLAFTLPRMGLVRSMSTDQGPDLLKSALRDLYRLVHPDFFHQHPEARVRRPCLGSGCGLVPTIRDVSCASEYGCVDTSAQW